MKEEKWPSQPDVIESAEAETARVPKQQLQMFAKNEKDIKDAIDGLLQKNALWKVLKIAAYIL